MNVIYYLSGEAEAKLKAEWEPMKEKIGFREYAKGRIAKIVNEALGVTV
jgi:hypothetical protein